MGPRKVARVLLKFGWDIALGFLATWAVILGIQILLAGARYLGV